MISKVVEPRFLSFRASPEKKKEVKEALARLGITLQQVGDELVQRILDAQKSHRKGPFDPRELFTSEQEDVNEED